MSALAEFWAPSHGISGWMLCHWTSRAMQGSGMVSGHNKNPPSLPITYAVLQTLFALSTSLTPLVLSLVYRFTSQHCDYSGLPLPDTLIALFCSTILLGSPFILLNWPYCLWTFLITHSRMYLLCISYSYPYQKKKKSGINFSFSTIFVKKSSTYSDFAFRWGRFFNYVNLTPGTGYLIKLYHFIAACQEKGLERN